MNESGRLSVSYYRAQGRSYFRVAVRLFRTWIIIAGDWAIMPSVHRMRPCKNCFAETRVADLQHGLCAPCRIVNYMRVHEPNHPTFWKEPHA